MHNDGLGLGFPETPEDIPSRVRRRNGLGRPSDKPVHELANPETTRHLQSLPSGELHELDAGPAWPLNEEDEALVRTFETGQSVPRIVRSSDDESLRQAMERSQRDIPSPLKRTDTGTDEEELARAISLSLQIR